MKYRPYKYITVSRDVQGGSPCIINTRTPLTTILNELAGGLSLDEICKDRNIPIFDAQGALKELTQHLKPELPMKIEIVAHTDKGKISVSDEFFGVPSPDSISDLAKTMWTKIIKETDLNPYSFWITNIGSKKIQMIKLVRELTGMGLKESKEIVESGPFLLPIKEKDMNKEFGRVSRELDAMGAKYRLLGEAETAVHKVMHA